jgi:hypothetical protein
MSPAFSDERTGTPPLTRLTVTFMPSTRTNTGFALETRFMAFLGSVQELLSRGPTADPKQGAHSRVGLSLERGPKTWERDAVRLDGRRDFFALPRLLLHEL